MTDRHTPSATNPTAGPATPAVFVSHGAPTLLLEGGPAFTLLAQHTLGERVRATPAVAGNRLFIRGQYHLFCIGEPSSR